MNVPVLYTDEMISVGQTRYIAPERIRKTFAYVVTY